MQAWLAVVDAFFDLGLMWGHAPHGAAAKPSVPGLRDTSVGKTAKRTIDHGKVARG